jgi:hypothetical protein
MMASHGSWNRRCGRSAVRLPEGRLTSVSKMRPNTVLQPTPLRWRFAARLNTTGRRGRRYKHSEHAR